MTFRVYEHGSGRDVTDEKRWYIDKYGYLSYWTGSNDNTPFELAGKEYYFKLEIELPAQI